MPEVWRWDPQTLSEMLEFETDIRATVSGEWRDSLKDATQFFYFSHVLNNAKAEEMIAAVRANSFGDWLVPEWPSATKSITPLASGVSTVSVDVPEAYRVGNKAIVWLSSEVWEEKTVSAIGATDITFSSPLVGSYGANGIRPLSIAPLVLCIAPEGVQFVSSFPSQVLSITFMSMDPVDLSENPYDLFEDIPVVTDADIPFSALAGQVYQSLDVMASRFGAYEVQEAETFVRRRGTFSWMKKGPEAIWSMRKFAHYLRGMDSEFWAPTGQKDLVLQAPVDAADLSIFVLPIASDAEIVGKSLLIKEGAQAVYRTVISAVTTAGVQELEIDPPSVDFSQSAVVSLMHKSRLDTDNIVIDYQFVAGNLAAFSVLPIVEVP